MLQSDTLSKEQIQDWLEKLRSGEYKQARQAWALFVDDSVKGYCCLSVLGAEVLNIATWEGLHAPCTLDTIPIEELVDKTFSMSNDSFTGDLIYWNDDGFTFLEIADRIEARAREKGLL